MVKDNRFIDHIYEYEDPRMKAVAKVLQDEEMRQAAGRIRPLDGCRAKKIYVLSNIPIQGLRPNRLELLGKIDSAKKELFKEIIATAKKAGTKINVSKICREEGINYSTARIWLNEIDEKEKGTEQGNPEKKVKR